MCAQADHVIEKRKGRLKLGALAADVQALRDVKHFVKDYKGHLPLSLPPPGIAGFHQASTCFACMPHLRHAAYISSCISTTSMKLSMLLMDAAARLGSYLHYVHICTWWVTAHALNTENMPAALFLQVGPPQVFLRLLQAALARYACCFKSSCQKRTLLQPPHIAHQSLLLNHPLQPGMSHPAAAPTSSPNIKYGSNSCHQDAVKCCVIARFTLHRHAL